MIGLARWLRLRSGEEEAKEQLEKSKTEQVSTRRLAEEVRHLHEDENHITARVHAAMRGGRS